MDDPRIDPRAFDWDAHWPDGFDVVLGNPPYVRQERFGPAVKAHWRASFRAFHGTADVYVYFVERALRALVAGGRLAFVVSDKWLRGAYAGPLRALLGREYTIDSLVDFGHAPVFADADAFPCLVTIRRTAPAPDHAVAVTHYPRARFARTDLAAHIASNRFPIAQRSLDAGPWHLDPPAVAALIAKMHRAGVPLAEYAGTKPHYGVKTGLNEAFVIDALTRESLVRAQPSLADILVPHAGGRDIARWTFEPSNRFLVLLKSSTDHAWPWSRANTRDAERIFAATYPALHARMHPMKRALERRTDRGTHWWELRACAYYGAFAQPKIVYQVIQFHPRYALDRAGTFTNDKTFSLPTADPWLLAVLNAPLLWWHNWRTFVHMKDDALNPAADKMLALPIARPTDEQRDAVEALVPEIIALTTANQDARRDMLAWLAREAGIATPGRKLGAFETMDAGAFVDAIRAECALTTTLAHALATAHAERAPAMRDRAERVRAHECAIAARVHSAYGLSAADEGVLRETAVPRTVGQVGG